MSKLYNQYLLLKKENSSKLYLFKSGMFYIFSSDDAKKVCEKLNLKLTNLNNDVVKCGFPINSLSKFSNLLFEHNFSYEIIDETKVISKEKYIENENIQNS